MGRSALIMLGLIVASLVDRSTITSTGVVLPWVEGNIGLSGDEGPLVTLSYNAALYCGILMSPWMLRRFGRPRYLALSITTYGFAALLCAGSTSLSELVCLRIVLGFAEGGFFMPSLLTILANVPPKIAPYFILVYGALTQCATAFAPLLGGTMVEDHTWRTLYLVLSAGAFCAAALVFASAYRSPLDERLRDDRRAVDVGGMMLLASTIAAYSYATAYGPQRNWLESADVSAATIIFGVSAVALVLWEVYGAKSPVLPLAILSHRNVWVGVALGLSIGFPMFGITELVRYLQGSLGFTLQISGEVIALRAVAIVVVVPLGTILVSRGVDSRILVALGFLVSLSAFCWESIGMTSGSEFHTFVGAELLVGVGFGFTFAPILNAVVSNVSFLEMPYAAAMMNCTFTLAGSFANAWQSTVYDRREVKHLADLASETTLSQNSVHSFLASNGSAALHILAGLTAQQASVMAFADVALCSATVAAIAIPVTMFLKPARPIALVLAPEPVLHAEGAS